MSCRPTADCVAVPSYAGPRPAYDDNSNCCGACEAGFCAPEPIVKGVSAKRCQLNPRSLGQICHRNKWQRRCNGSNRCAWGRKRIKGHWKSVGVCKRKPAKPIFNCASTVIFC